MDAGTERINLNKTKRERYRSLEFGLLSRKRKEERMEKKMTFHYFYGTEADQFSFYRIPKALFTDDYFKNLSSDAKILYGLMLDRMSLSIKNQWFDDQNRAYIYFSIEDIMELLNCGRNKAMADTILEEYKIRLQKNKISVVALTMTECYKKLANKKTLINRISMDPITLDLYYEDYNGIEINKASLSAGEKQLMVISLLWALALCSKKKLPVIIDTPLSRLDSAHREALITTYFPQASEQTIILSTDSEIDRNYHDMMKNNIGDEFTLIYDDDSKSTTIQRGYFGEGDA